MCVERELDRDTRRDDKALEEIRRLFARYRDLARQAPVSEREEEREETPALAGR